MYTVFYTTQTGKRGLYYGSCLLTALHCYCVSTRETKVIARIEKETVLKNGKLATVNFITKM